MSAQAPIADSPANPDKAAFSLRPIRCIKCCCGALYLVLQLNPSTAAPASAGEAAMSIAQHLREAAEAHRRRVERADSVMIELHGVQIDARHEWIDGEIEVIALLVGGVDIADALVGVAIAAGRRPREYFGSDAENAFWRDVDGLVRTEVARKAAAERAPLAQDQAYGA
jgi:hypothetical protein